MPAMLRHKPTGDLYIYTELLSRRADMEEYSAPEEPAIAPKPKARNVAKKKAAAKKVTPAPVEPTVAEPTGLAADLLGVEE